MQKGTHKAVFLDRDGTINIEKHYLYHIEDFEYTDGAVEGMRKLSDAGFLLVIVTNQSGIARGYYTEEDYMALDKWLRQDLAAKEIKIAGSYFCPHFNGGVVQKYSVECECRKPKTGLFWQAQSELDIDMDDSFAIGDKMRDLSICWESGVQGILFSDEDAEIDGVRICKSWEEVTDYILEGKTGLDVWSD